MILATCLVMDLKQYIRCSRSMHVFKQWVLAGQVKTPMINGVRNVNQCKVHNIYQPPCNSIPIYYFFKVCAYYSSQSHARIGSHYGLVMCHFRGWITLHNIKWSRHIISYNIWITLCVPNIKYHLFSTHKMVQGTYHQTSYAICLMTCKLIN